MEPESDVTSNCPSYICISHELLISSVLYPIIMLSHILLNLLICSLSTLRFGPRWAKVPWTFSTSLPQSNPSRPYQESHSHGALLNGVWTINTLSRHSFLCPNNFQNQVDLFQLHYKRLGT